MAYLSSFLLTCYLDTMRTTLSDFPVQGHTFSLLMFVARLTDLGDSGLLLRDLIQVTILGIYTE